MARKQCSGFKIRRITLRQHGYSYHTWEVSGTIAGERIRKRFRSRDEAMGEKAVLDVRAANAGEIRALNTRMSSAQLAEAETAFRRLAGVSLTEAVDFYLTNFRPPIASVPIEQAVGDFEAAHKPDVEPVHHADVKRKLALLGEWFAGRTVAEIAAADIEARMQARKWAPKTWNNVRGCFGAFFDFCADPRRGWVASSPIAEIEPRKVVRGIPQIETAARIAELFAFLETHTGGLRQPHRPGFLVPYFALATFAGIRPAIPSGEVCKIGRALALGSEKQKIVDLEVGVIRLAPALAKTDCVRQVKIRPNLAAWLVRYPLDEFPIIIPNLQALVTAVRKRFELGDDVLRHTFISMHVAAFKSVGEAALEAGNSESIIRIHYLNLVSEAEAAAFWAIAPRA